MSRPVQIVRQKTSHRALALDLYVAFSILERTRDRIIVDCCTRFSDWTGARDEERFLRTTPDERSLRL